MTKKVLALSMMALLLANSAQALDTSVKPTVTDLGITPQSYMLVGNSFTFYSCGMHNMINRLAKEGGFKIRRNRMVTIGGADLGWFNVWDLLRPTGMAATYVDHSDGNKIKSYDFTKEKIFDVVILQDNSKGPIDPQRKDIFQKYLKLHAYDMSVLNIKPMVMMTWAWEGKPEMTKQLADATTKAANESGVMVIPAGLAFAEALKERPNLKLYRADHFHPSAAGTYLAGCVTYSTMFKTSPEGYKFTGVDPIDEETAAFLQKIAWRTTKDFFSWK